jgi:hypothetical protein
MEVRNMARKNLEFDAHNALLFRPNHNVDPRNFEAFESHMLEWKSTSKAFANALREAADWLDEHEDDDILVEID